MPYTLQLLAAGLGLTVLGVSLMQNLLYVGLLLVAFGVMLARPKALPARNLWAELAEVAPPITVLVPAYNEEATILESVRSLVGLHYPEHRVIVINDGSTDATLDQLVQAFDLRPILRPFRPSLAKKPVRGLYASPRQPRLLVVDKANGGKSDALNAGLDLAETPLVCSVDADSLLETDSLLRAVQPFVDDPERTAIVGGNIRVINGCLVRHGRIKAVRLPTRLLALLQTVEYLRAFMMARLAWERLGVLMIVSGAFGIFKRELAVAVGGYSDATVGEDLELVVRIHRHLRARGEDYAIRYVPEPVCWTQVPEQLGTLARQRIRWQRGALESLAIHRRMFRERTGGRVAWLGLGHILALDLLAPLVEVMGYVLMPVFLLLDVYDWEFFLAYLALTFGFGIVVSVGTLVLEELELRRFPHARDLALLGAAAVVENLGYRQIANVWRIVGLWRWARGAGSEWGTMVRRRFKAA